MYVSWADSLPDPGLVIGDGPEAVTRIVEYRWLRRPAGGDQVVVSGQDAGSRGARAGANVDLESAPIEHLRHAANIVLDGSGVFSGSPHQQCAADGVVHFEVPRWTA